MKHRASTFFWRLDTEVAECLWPKGTLLVVDRALRPREGGYVVAVADDEFLLCQFYTKGLQRLGGMPVEAEFWGVVTFAVQPLGARS